ncbi:DedA family protein [Almyronema epifaneia]|uniref:DedA family protein n=1 Tax=Almyronema epifaneia S1 TaxID=2991925 RepID=A0ABW6IC22_9CYAN
MLEWVTNTIGSMGYVGIVFLMFLENLFPPIPSEIIMPLAGFGVAQGNLNLGLVILSGSLGSILGAFPWYYLGRTVKAEKLESWADRYGRWLTLSSKDVRRVVSWFAHRRGNLAVGLGRLVPGIRTYISIPAGLTRMPMVPFLFYSTLGTVVWISFLSLMGYVLGANYERVRTVLGPASGVVWLFLIGGFIVLVVTRWLRQLAR